jgi:hypothetical protein
MSVLVISLLLLCLSFVSSSPADQLEVFPAESVVTPTPPPPAHATPPLTLTKERMKSLVEQEIVVSGMRGGMQGEAL